MEDQPDLEQQITDDAGARRMLEVLTDPETDTDIRGEAAINLGPGLQTCRDRQSWDDPGVYFSRRCVEEIDETFRTLFDDDSTAPAVRRRILEAAVRYPRDWHDEAIRTAFESDDDKWRQTALFAMGYMPGFEDEIRGILDGDAISDDLLRVAVRAAGRRAVEGTEPVLRQLATDRDCEQTIRLAAIEALTHFDDEESETTLERLTTYPNQNIATFAGWAIKEWRKRHDIPEERNQPPPGGFH